MFLSNLKVIETPKCVLCVLFLCVFTVIVCVCVCVCIVQGELSGKMGAVPANFVEDLEPDDPLSADTLELSSSKQVSIKCMHCVYV